MVAASNIKDLVLPQAQRRKLAEFFNKVFHHEQNYCGCFLWDSARTNKNKDLLDHDDDLDMNIR